MFTNSCLKLALPVLAALSLTAIALPASASEMWGCSPAGVRQVSIHLIDRGGRSYVKIAGKRIPADLETDRAGQRWSFANQSVVLSPNHNATYYVDGAVKGHFVCRPFGKHD